MIQRIQTAYLFLAFITCLASPFIRNFDIAAVFSVQGYLCLFWLSALVSMISVFLYKSRTKQILLGRINIGLNVVLLSLSVYINLVEKIELSLIIISIIFLVLANRAIKKDEELVKSADRLR